MKKLMANKYKKERALFDSGYKLYITKGIRQTTINDIVELAGVAKGSFYTYFTDKYALLDCIIIEKSALVIMEAYAALKSQGKTGKGDAVSYIISFTDYIIEYFKNNVVILELLNKNLSWGLFKKAVLDDQNKEIEFVYKELRRMLHENNVDDPYLDENLFMIIELISSTCYSSIIMKEPKDIDDMKPILFNMIRKMIKN